VCPREDEPSLRVPFISEAKNFERRMLDLGLKYTKECLDLDLELNKQLDLTLD
jgi:hypothetical protein